MPRTASARARFLRLMPVVLLYGCASAMLPHSPAPSDPWFGTTGNALIGEGGTDHDGIKDYLWVGFSSAVTWKDFQDVSQKGGWVDGKIVVAPGTPLGFYFDPQTTDAGEITIEACQTDIDSIKANPVKFTQGVIT